MNLFILLFIVTLFVGLFLVFLGIYYYKRTKTSENWPFTEGIIVDSDLTKSRDNDGQISYRPEIVFEYKLGNKNYKSNKIDAFINYTSSTSSRALKLINRYPIGTKINVYYDPKMPSFGILEPGLKKGSILLLSIGFILLMFSIVFLSNSSVF
ncbi:MAG: DUF3592 domain-containing protein [Chitinophagaceae bacterium]|nr:DUF3592 domain-containing protein [Chitinophagaceae bacterium]